MLSRTYNKSILTGLHVCMYQRQKTDQYSRKEAPKGAVVQQNTAWKGKLRAVSTHTIFFCLFSCKAMGLLSAAEGKADKEDKGIPNYRQTRLHQKCLTYTSDLSSCLCKQSSQTTNTVLSAQVKSGCKSLF